MSKREKSWKDIEDSRNKRLWLTGVIIPVAGMCVTLYAHVPEVRRVVNDIPHNVKKKVAHLKNRFHRKE